MDLSSEQQLALNRRWMIREHQPLIQMALEAGHAVVWSRNVKDLFVNNGAHDELSHRPASWSQLGTALRMDPKHVSRWAAEKDGTNGSLRGKLTLPATTIRYRVAFVLCVKESELSPSSREWVAESARWLVTLNRPDLAPRFENPQFLAYADYLSAECDDLQAKQLCSDGLAAARQNAPGKDADQIKDDILDVAKVIGDILANDVGLELEA